MAFKISADPRVLKIVGKSVSMYPIKLYDPYINEMNSVIQVCISGIDLTSILEQLANEFGTEAVKQAANELPD